jgi:hypothetical protein
MLSYWMIVIMRSRKREVCRRGRGRKISRIRIKISMKRNGVEKRN